MGSCSSTTVSALFYTSNVLNVIVWNRCRCSHRIAFTLTVAKSLYVFVFAAIGCVWPDDVPLVFSLALVAQVVTVGAR